MIDAEGYRANVGVILCNSKQQLFWGHRIGHLDSWQFPQGGIQANETPLEAMYRELGEEVGLTSEQVIVLGQTRGWLRYRLPPRLIRRNNIHRCIGQKQIWFLLRLVDDQQALSLDHTEQPEFDQWRWVDYWYPVNNVVHFKRHVYQCALRELGVLLFDGKLPPRHGERCMGLD